MQLKQAFGILGILAVFLLLFSGCSESPTGQLIRNVPEKEPEQSYDKFISAFELQNILNNKDAKIVDLRQAWQYNAGHIPNAINIPSGELDSIRMNAEGIDKKFRIIIYDGSGSFSLAAFEILSRSGFGKVQILEGGYQDWVKNELLVEQSY